MKLELFDAVALGDARITKHGYLVADARVARTGIQDYRGFEVGKPEIATVRVYRPETEVFSRDAMASFAHRPTTIDHPPEMVTAENWSKYAVGDTGDEVVRDGDYIRVPLTLMDKSAIDAVRAGKRELSAGYFCDLDFTPGKTPAGEAYDAVQRNIRGNHLAVVDAARAGSKCRIGDVGVGKEASPHNKDQVMTLQKLTIDGITVEVSDTAAQVVMKLQALLADANAKVDKAESARTTAEDAHKKALEAKDGEIAALKSKIIDEKALDALLAQRAVALEAAKKLIGDKFDASGKSIADIRRAAVAARLGDAAVKDKSDDYIAAAFDTLSVTAKDAGGNPLADALRDGKPARDAASTAYDTYLNDLSNAWKGPDQKGAH
ncbi:MAG: DUF2213 domain-containing protein [Methylocystis sp.]